MRRTVGALLVAGGATAGALGALWVFLAIVGREWDYCPRGGCIAGELVGGAIVAGAVVAASVGLALLRKRGA